MKFYSREELSDKLTFFCEAFEHKTEKKLDLERVKAFLHEQLKQTEDKMINSAFCEMSHEAARVLLDIIAEKQTINMQKTNKRRKNHAKSE